MRKWEKFGHIGNKMRQPSKVLVLQRFSWHPGEANNGDLRHVSQG